MMKDHWLQWPSTQTSWLQNIYCSTVHYMMLWGGTRGRIRRFWGTSCMATWGSWGGQLPSWGQQASPSGVRRRRRRNDLADADWQTNQFPAERCMPLTNGMKYYGCWCASKQLPVQDSNRFWSRGWLRHPSPTCEKCDQSKNWLQKKR